MRWIDRIVLVLRIVKVIGDRIKATRGSNESRLEDNESDRGSNACVIATARPTLAASRPLRRARKGERQCAWATSAPRLPPGESVNAWQARTLPPAHPRGRTRIAPRCRPRRGCGRRRHAPSWPARFRAPVLRLRPASVQGDCTPATRALIALPPSAARFIARATIVEVGGTLPPRGAAARPHSWHTRLRRAGVERARARSA